MVRVSVIMGVHNGAGRVGSAVDSILKQSFPDLEMIICDDASSDDTYRVLEDFAARDDRLVLLHNQSNLGLAGSLNRCLDVARGDYIARMDDDDVSLPGRLRAQVAAFDEFRDCSILGGAALLFDEKGEYGRISPLRAPTRLDVFRSAPFVHPTVMMRREHLMSVGGYTVAGYARRTEDYDLWNKMYSAGYSGRNLNECVLRYYKGRDGFALLPSAEILPKTWFRRRSLVTVRPRECGPLTLFLL